MKDTVATSGPLGGEGKVVEADELYYGTRETPRPSPYRKGRPYIKKGNAAQKRVILGLVERGGNVRTFMINDATTAEHLEQVLAALSAYESEPWRITEVSILQRGDGVWRAVPVGG